ncbi:MAG: zinc ribbon domain-containing protein [Clostridia bacterium]|nr:zinc ribbon domain-containing protein [Clostridia bacterium]
MALIELKCEACGYVGEELIKSDGKYPPCPKCGKPLQQVYAGKCYVNVNKCGGNCSGNCKTCGGCH